jgi:hypothetical protein
MVNTSPEAANPNAMSKADLARMLSRVGNWPITVDMIEADVANGAPSNSDGSMSLIHYGAWLVSELAHSEGAGER